MKNFERDCTIPKQIISFKEALKYLDVSESFLYKLTSQSKITFFKPNNGKLYFKKEDLDKWMLQNENKTVSDIAQDLTFKISKNGK